MTTIRDGYAPTDPARIEALLSLAGVGPGDTLLDLGSGDGRVLLEAVRRGAQVAGVECDMSLAVQSTVGEQYVGDFWQHDWSPYTVVFAAASAQLRDPVVERWRALSHRDGDRLIVLADGRFAEVHLALCA